MLGTIGELLIYAAFAACLIAAYGFFQAARSEEPHVTGRPEGAGAEWLPVARGAWGVMMVATVAASALLMYLIVTNQFQYHYVYNYSSRELPLRYLTSSFWAGQEGSFLLWILYNGVIGLGLFWWARRFEAPVMTVISVCQAFLLLMILGAQIGPLKLGASPFITLAEKYPDAPMLKAGFVPPDGSGLNDLLQNYWMVIHPPTLFVGFSTMIVPFAYAVAGLWKRAYTEWVKPCLPWALFANLILIVGIAMGGYWAYVTLSFGGYWAWDPVENSSLVPWLVGVAAIHTMISQKKSGSSQKAAIFLSILAYLLVIYSTFLTRSGILGDVSVHSFVSLGLYNQLLVWMGTMALIGFGLFFYRYDELPTPDQKPRILSREFMIFTGAMILCAIGGVILLGTSAPIFGKLFRANPSAVPIQFYNQWSLPLGVILAFLAGLGQLFWWKKMSVENVNQVVMKPLSLAIVSTALVLVLTPFVPETVDVAAIAPEPPQISAQAGIGGLTGEIGALWNAYGQSFLLMLLVFSSFFALYGNGMVLWRIGRGNPKLAGGAVAHLGLVLIIFGLITSSGFSDPISEGRGVDMGDTPYGNNRDNFIVERGDTVRVDGYTVTYTGRSRTVERNRPEYHVRLTGPTGRTFEAQPVVYQNDQGQWIQHPDVKAYPFQDVYVAVSPNVMFQTGSDSTSQKGAQVDLRQGETATLGRDEYTLTFNRFDVNVQNEMVPDSAAIAVAADLELTNEATGETRSLRPIYMVMQDRSQQFIQNRVSDWGLTVTFGGMNVETESAELYVDGVEAEPEDWLVVQAYEKPYINLLWLGTLILCAGFGLAIFRRVSDMMYRAARGLW